MLRGSLLMRVPTIDTGEGLCHVEFQGAPEGAQNWFVGSADTKDAFHQMRRGAVVNCTHGAMSIWWNPMSSP